MSNAIIKVENLGKKYLIHHQATERYIALRDDIAGKAAFVGRRLLNTESRGNADNTREEFWALKDVSFEVRRGEVIGIIGRNGAGKSTLLKILSRITEPTTGRIRIKGRLASLLEVGTGFHPELTGRENIYLNGAILGMSKTLIKSKFDEIVSFAEVEKFLDTPVKRYSSGMYVRLAFAVAAHLEPEILLVDEVLAVGDNAFQKKCLGKMGKASKQGRTLLFVSHNMAAISKLCKKCILLDKGNIKKIGSTNNVLPSYLSDGQKTTGFIKFKNPNERAAGIKELGVLNSKMKFSAIVEVNKDFYIWIKFFTKRKYEVLQIAIAILTSDGNTVFVTTNTDAENQKTIFYPNNYAFKVRIPDNFLNVGNYSINARIFTMDGNIRHSLDSHFYALNFNVEETGSLGSKLNDRRRGIVTPTLDWELT
jgi:lipopolysaccharide transport system ATP-binding protein